MTRVRQEELDYAWDGLYYHNERPFTGVVVYLSKDGWARGERPLVEEFLAVEVRQDRHDPAVHGVSDRIRLIRHP